MIRPDFTKLALDLVHNAIDIDILTEAHEGLICAEDAAGALDAACIALDAGDLPAALARFDAAVRIASEPPEAPTAGRNRLDRHQAAIRQRNQLLTVTQICRVLVLDAIKTGGAA